MTGKPGTRIPVLLLICCGLICGQAHGQDDLEYVDSLLWSKAYDIEVAGDYAYCSFLNGLLVLDISDKRDPVSISRLYLGGGFGINLQENLACIAAGENGLWIVDVSDPASPVLNGGFNTPGEAKGVTVRGRYALVADGPEGLQVIDISNPVAPELVASFDTPGMAEGIAVSGDHLYVADGPAGLQIVDISDASSPGLTGTIDTPGNAERVALSGHLAYVADGSAGLQIVDVSDPGAPELLSTFAASGYAHGIAVEGDYAYLANLYDGALLCITRRGRWRWMGSTPTWWITSRVCTSCRSRIARGSEGRREVSSLRDRSSRPKPPGIISVRSGISRDCR
jgi:hypothetical protein